MTIFQTTIGEKDHRRCGRCVSIAERSASTLEHGNRCSPTLRFIGLCYPVAEIKPIVFFGSLKSRPGAFPDLSIGVQIGVLLKTINQIQCLSPEISVGCQWIDTTYQEPFNSNFL